MSTQPPPFATEVFTEQDAPRTVTPFGRRLLTVIGMRELGAYRVLHVADPAGPGEQGGRGGRAPHPGQFAMLAAAERWGGGEDERPYLPRAFSYARWHEGEAQFLLEDVGPGTQRLCELGEGEGLWLLGPLGQGFTAPEHSRRALLVGGGVGIAPLAILQDHLNAIGSPNTPGAVKADRVSGENVTVLLGFRDRAHAEGATLLESARLASDDGSVGRHGLVTDLLVEELEEDPHATVYACGPPAMLEAVRGLCAERSIPAQLALEAGMACGFGACFGCVVPTRADAYARVCVDGPVFDAQLLSHVEAHTGTGA